jgi:hypothetical protein
MNPTTAAALINQHRRDLTANAEAYRLAWVARSQRPVAAGHAGAHLKIIPHLITAATQIADRLSKVPRSAPVLVADRSRR